MRAGYNEVADKVALTRGESYDALASALYSSMAESPMALKMLKGGEPEYYGTMGNGYFAGSDFVELGVKAGLIGKAVKNRITSLARKVQKTAPAIIEASFMPEEMKDRYQALISDRLRFVSLLEPGAE